MIERNKILAGKYPLVANHFNNQIPQDQWQPGDIIIRDRNLHITLSNERYYDVYRIAENGVIKTKNGNLYFEVHNLGTVISDWLKEKETVLFGFISKSKGEEIHVLTDYEVWEGKTLTVIDPKKMMLFKNFVIFQGNEEIKKSMEYHKSVTEEYSK